MIDYKSEFTGKIVWVTGGTSGIGLKICEDMCSYGAIVITNFAKNEAAAKKCTQELQSKGYSFDVLQADISSEDGVLRVVEYIQNKYNKLDYLVNNAGIGDNGSLENTTSELFDRVMKVNLYGKFYSIKHCKQLLLKSTCPAVVNISSRLGLCVSENYLAYSCAAAGVINLTKSAATELAKSGIRVNCISPSMTITPMVTSKTPKEDLEKWAALNPLHRLGEVRDMSSLVMWLLSEDSFYINGENVNINGGRCV